MNPGHAVPRPLPAQPVADLPVDALLARAQELSKGWLVALLEQRELGDAPALLAADVVREGPRLCGAVVRALADDEDLRRLAPGGALEPLAARAGESAGSSGLEPTVRSVDALSAVIWGALRQELPAADAPLVAALAQRLALVTDVVRAAVLRRCEAGLAGGESGADGEPDALGAVDAPDALGVSGARGEPSAARPLYAVRESATPVTSDSPWRAALDDEVARARRSGAKLALVLAELSDADRVSDAESLHLARDGFGPFARAVRSALRRGDILACETESRAWTIARTTGRAGARALGSRIASAVQHAEPWRGAPVTVGIGIAILGEDAHDSAGLIEAADEWSFAAVSAGAGAAAGEPSSDAGAGDHAVGGGSSG